MDSLTETEGDQEGDDYQHEESSDSEESFTYLPEGNDDARWLSPRRSKGNGPFGESPPGSHFVRRDNDLKRTLENKPSHEKIEDNVEESNLKERTSTGRGAILDKRRATLKTTIYPRSRLPTSQKGMITLIGNH